MPALKYDDAYVNRSNQGLARNAKSKTVSQTMSAQRKVASHSSQAKTRQRRYQHTDIDVPIVVKKKVELQKPEEMKLQKPKAEKIAQTKTESAKKSIVATVLAFGMLFVICTRYAQINELTHELNMAEKELVAATSLNQQLSAEVDSKTDLSYIEKYAKYQLGMQKPDEKQVVRIAYDKQDKISTPIIIEEEKEPSFMEKLWNDLKNLVD